MGATPLSGGLVTMDKHTRRFTKQGQEYTPIV